MNNTYTRLFAIMAFLVALTACVPEGPTPQQKFEGLYRACRTLQGAISVGVSRSTFGELQQRFATEILIAVDHAASEDEKAMIKAYTEVADTYKDSAALWEGMTKVPEVNGKIRVWDGLLPFVAKYQIPTEKQQRQYNDIVTYDVISADSMQHIWVVADEKAQKAIHLYFALTDKKTS